jgi:tripartite-type tricarboxylate transporter receptor subunit TctC
VVLVAPDQPARDHSGLSEALRVRSAACGTPGAGSFLHLSTLLLARALETECAVLRYPDKAAGVEYLRTGRIHVFLNLLPAGMPAVRAWLLDRHPSPHAGGRP